MSVSFADHCVHVLWHHAEQVGAADLSARLHEEPPGLPPRPPCASVALLQLHVHACWVRNLHFPHVDLFTSDFSQHLAGCRRCCAAVGGGGGGDKYGMLAFESCFFSPRSVCSLEQLGFNALLQLMIGVPLEMVHGILRISLLYMAGVVAGECLGKC